jgi:hypothetical protein
MVVVPVVVVPVELAPRVPQVPLALMVPQVPLVLRVLLAPLAPLVPPVLPPPLLRLPLLRLLLLRLLPRSLLLSPPLRRSMPKYKLIKVNTPIINTCSLSLVHQHTFIIRLRRQMKVNRLEVEDIGVNIRVARFIVRILP